MVGLPQVGGGERRSTSFLPWLVSLQGGSRLLKQWHGILLTGTHTHAHAQTHTQRRSTSFLPCLVSLQGCRRQHTYLTKLYPFVLIAPWVRERKFDSSVRLAHILKLTIKFTLTSRDAYCYTCSFQQFTDLKDFNVLLVNEPVVSPPFVLNDTPPPHAIVLRDR